MFSDDKEGTIEKTNWSKKVTVPAQISKPNTTSSFMRINGSALADITYIPFYFILILGKCVSLSTGDSPYFFGVREFEFVLLIVIFKFKMLVLLTSHVLLTIYTRQFLKNKSALSLHVLKLPFLFSFHERKS